MGNITEARGNIRGSLVDDPLTSGATSLTLDNEFTAKTVPSDFYLTIGEDTDFANSTVEYVRYSGFTRNGDGTSTFSGLSRGVDNTSAQEWAKGTTVAISLPGVALENLPDQSEDFDIGNNNLNNLDGNRLEVPFPLHKRKITTNNHNSYATTGILKVSGDEKLILVYTEGYGTGNTDSRMVAIDSYDKGQHWQNERTLYDTDTHGISHGAVGVMGSGRLGILARRQDSTGDTVDPIFLYSDDDGSTWSSSVISSVSSDFHMIFFNIHPYPASVGGDDSQGYVAFAHTLPHGDIRYIYTTDNGSSWTDGIAISGDTGEEPTEATVARLGTEDKWVMAWRRGQSAGLNMGLAKSTDLTTWTDKTKTSTPKLGKNPALLTNWNGKFHLFGANRVQDGRPIKEELGDGFLYQNQDEDDLWNDLTNWPGWDLLVNTYYMKGYLTHTYDDQTDKHYLTYLAGEEGHGENYLYMLSDTPFDPRNEILIQPGSDTWKNRSYQGFEKHDVETIYNIGSDPTDDYESLEKAFADLRGLQIQKNLTLELQENITENSRIRPYGLPATGGQVTINLNGKTLTVSYGSSRNYGIQIPSGSNFTITGSGTIKTGNSNISNALIRVNPLSFLLLQYITLDANSKSMDAILQVQQGRAESGYNTTYSNYSSTSYGAALAWDAGYIGCRSDPPTYTAGRGGEIILSDGTDIT